MRFKPSVALLVYKHPRAPSLNTLDILDPTMGWGGRLFSAAALGARSYTGIDLNKNLETGYDGIREFLSGEGCPTRVECFFTDAITFDYSQLEYNMVFTSPPYYNTEIYSGMTRLATKKKWNEEFYKPLFSNTMKHLSVGGVYCLNVPEEVYDNVCVPLLGEACDRILMTLSSRTQNLNARSLFIFGRK
jgi:hypothetical protein